MQIKTGLEGICASLPLVGRHSGKQASWDLEGEGMLGALLASQGVMKCGGYLRWISSP